MDCSLNREQQTKWTLKSFAKKSYQRTLLYQNKELNRELCLFLKLGNSWPQSDTYNINLYKTPTNLVLEVKTNKTKRKGKQQMLGGEQSRASLRLASFVHETKQTNYLTIKISTCSELTFNNNNTVAIQRYRYKVTNHCTLSRNTLDSKFITYS